MIGAKIHGGLLAVALLLALQTWSREAPTEIELERILIWEQDTSAVLQQAFPIARETNPIRYAAGWLMAWLLLHCR